MTTRREWLSVFGAGLLAAPVASIAQQQRSRIARIGLLEAASAATDEKWRNALIAGLRELGYVQGSNLTIEYRWADGKYENLARLAGELVQMKLDVIVAASSPAIRAAQRATSTIPIVMVRTGNPVGQGFVATLSRPGRNITGLSNINIDVSSKYLELLRIAVPKLSRVAALVNSASPNYPNNLKPVQAAGNSNGVTILPALASNASEIEAVFAAMKQEHAGALIVLPDSFFLGHARWIGELAARQRLPTMFWTREPVEAEGLMSYGQNNAEHYYRAATYVDKILKGAKPGDLPVEQPTKIELVINLKTAKAIGLTIPKDLLFRADKVIE
jgi:putative ABC transport system substrate-binding protein